MGDVRRSRRSFRRWDGAAVALVAALAVTGGTIAPASGAPATPAAAPAAAASVAAPAVPDLDWQACGADFPGAECAVATVPLDYDRPRGATTEVALARIPASDPAHRIGSVFVNPGGPGGSGVGLVLFGFGDHLNAELDGRFDVVGFDPRGVGASDPLHCFDSATELFDFFGSQPVFPYRNDQYAPYYDQGRQLGPECHDDHQAIADHMSTADVARDLDLLRQAVGDRKLTYLGFSYGTYLGNTYANLFPRNVRALVIDGTLDPRLWSSGWQITSDRVATQAEFDEFLRLCDEAGADCAFSAPGGSKARFETLARSLRAHPVPLPTGGFYTYDMLINDVTGSMYSPEEWGGDEGTGALLDGLADAVIGDQAAAARVAAVRRALIDRLTGPTAPAAATAPALAAPAEEADYDNGIDAYYGNQCADTQYPSTFAGFRLVDVFAAAGSRFGPLWWWGNVGCTNWPVNADRYVGPWTARTSAPVLVVGNFFDGITDHAGAEASARLLGNARLLSYAGWGHTAYDRSACVTGYVNAYLLRGALPPAGTVCPANPNPFVPSALRASESLVNYLGRPPTWWFRS
ncbi:MAG TPA: alpha/beta hydrolase [Acidimicrobiales bacterium]|jgi:pimeloyl-ACP methyl ester carboxylesterase|nr:alpha/beta hydrolase [Acidimicrobiales bacterium]